MRQFSVGLILCAFLAPCLGYSDTTLVNFKPTKAKKQINQKVLTKVLAEYYEQSFRTTSIKPTQAVSEISHSYKKKAKKELPLSTRIELAQTIKKFQAKEGKQVGFENTRNLASVLPSKKTASNSNPEEELE